MCMKKFLKNKKNNIYKCMKCVRCIKLYQIKQKRKRRNLYFDDNGIIRDLSQTRKYNERIY